MGRIFTQFFFDPLNNNLLDQLHAHPSPLRAAWLHWQLQLQSHTRTCTSPIDVKMNSELKERVAVDSTAFSPPYASSKEKNHLASKKEKRQRRTQRYLLPQPIASRPCSPHAARLHLHVQSHTRAQIHWLPQPIALPGSCCCWNWDQRTCRGVWCD